MLHRRSFKRFILISLALTGMAVSSAHAVSLNIDFGITTFPKGQVSDSGYGAEGTAGTWNQIFALGTKALVDLGGNATGINLTLEGDGLDIGVHNQNPKNDIQYLTDDSFGSTGNKNWFLTISNLIPDSIYDIFYYAPAHTAYSTGILSVTDIYTAAAKDGFKTLDLPGEKDSIVLKDGTNFGVFEDVTIGSLGIIDFRPMALSDPNLTGLSGLQLVQKSSGPIDPPSAVPVPAAVWLFGTALIGMIGFGKRRKAA